MSGYSLLNHSHILIGKRKVVGERIIDSIKDGMKVFPMHILFLTAFKGSAFVFEHCAFLGQKSCTKMKRILIFA